MEQKCIGVLSQNNDNFPVHYFSRFGIHSIKSGLLKQASRKMNKHVLFYPATSASSQTKLLEDVANQMKGLATIAMVDCS